MILINNNGDSRNAIYKVQKKKLNNISESIISEKRKSGNSTDKRK